MKRANKVRKCGKAGCLTHPGHVLTGHLVYGAVNGMKKCNVCNKILPINMFMRDVSNADGVRGYCNPCRNAKRRYQLHQAGRTHPMEQNRSCANFLGVVVAERALSRFFDNIHRMPFGNPGYDFVCGKGYKIDVKSSCLRSNNGISRAKWSFDIRRNKIADYFLCLAFDSRDNLAPLHVWLIPGNVISNHSTFSITNSVDPLKKWREYEHSLDRVMVCCHEIRASKTKVC